MSKKYIINWGFESYIDDLIEVQDDAKVGVILSDYLVDEFWKATTRAQMLERQIRFLMKEQKNEK